MPSLRPRFAAAAGECDNFDEVSQIDVLGQLGDGGAVAEQVLPAVDGLGHFHERAGVQLDDLHRDAAGAAPYRHEPKAT